MRILHIVPSIVERSDGVAFFVRELAKHQQSSGKDVTILTTEYVKNSKQEYRVLKFKYFQLLPSLRFSLNLILWFRKNYSNYDVIHNHGMWMMPNVLFNNIKGNVPKLIFSPHGTMSEEALKRNRIIKNLFWHILQKRAVLNSDLIHVTSKKEEKEVVQFLNKKIKTIIIPIGFDLPENIKNLNNSDKIIVFVGRIHPVKQVLELIEAWRDIEHTYPDWNLKIIGPIDSNYAKNCQKQANNYNLKNICFVGEKIGMSKFEEISSAKISILPSVTENFGVSVLECLALGIPSIVSENTPWHILKERKCGWIITPTIDGIREGISKAISEVNSNLHDYSRNSKDLAITDFSWKRVQEQMQNIYNCK